MFRRLVLPAPLGPITETMSPFATSRLTRLTAWTPPKAFDTSRTSRSALTTWSGRGRSRQPSLAAPVVLDVAVALALPDTGESQVELLDVLVVADRLRVAVEHDPPGLHDVAVLGEPERDGGVLLGEEHRHALLAVQPAHDLEDLLHQHR